MTDLQTRQAGLGIIKDCLGRVRQTCRYYPGSFVYQALKGNKGD